VAAGVYHYVTDRVLLNAGVSMSGEERSSRVGMTIGFGARRARQ
jgi:hypothetical protein